MGTRRNKRWFIKEVAEQARFTQGDVQILLKTMEEVIKDSIRREEVLNIVGLFKVSVTTIPEHQGYNAIKDEPMVIPESKRIVFRASRALLNVFK